MYLLNSKGDGAGSIPNKVLRSPSSSSFPFNNTYFHLQVLGVFLTAAYMVVKGKIFVKIIKLWREAFSKLMQSTK